MLKNRREVRTLIVLFATYALWLILLINAASWPSFVIILGLAIVLAQHSSLQHEAIHAHPFNRQWLSDAAVYLPIGVFIPYYRFRDLHIAHHNDAILTDPYDDPETNYLDPAVWSELPRSVQRLYRFNNTLLGRILVGPAIGLAAYYRDDWRLIRRGDKLVARQWGHHFIGLFLLILILAQFDIGTITYLISAYFGLSFLKIRTFTEHQAHIHAAARSVVIEDRGPLALLFLNNCYHAVHHIHPQIPWYDLPAKYRANREHYLRRNEHFVFKNYLEVFKHYFLRRKDDVPHPYFGREK